MDFTLKPVLNIINRSHAVFMNGFFTSTDAFCVCMCVRVFSEWTAHGGTADPNQTACKMALDRSRGCCVEKLITRVSALTANYLLEGRYF